MGIEPNVVCVHASDNEAGRWVVGRSGEQISSDRELFISHARARPPRIICMCVPWIDASFTLQSRVLVNDLA